VSDHTLLGIQAISICVIGLTLIFHMLFGGHR
jgi:hypothetical protein